jgi:hypothetical protein
LRGREDSPNEVGRPKKGPSQEPPNCGLTSRSTGPATAASAWPLQATAVIVLPRPVAVCLRRPVNSNVRQHPISFRVVVVLLKCHPHRLRQAELLSASPATRWAARRWPTLRGAGLQTSSCHSSVATSSRGVGRSLRVLFRQPSPVVAVPAAWPVAAVSKTEGKPQSLRFHQRCGIQRLGVHRLGHSWHHQYAETPQKCCLTLRSS